MATTTIDRTTELVSTTALTYMRQVDIQLNVKLLKPDTEMFVYFDGVNVSKFFTQTGGTLGARIFTSSSGGLSGNLQVPGMTFHVGEKKIVVTENPGDAVNLVGSSASAIFTTNGNLKRFKVTETTTNTTTVETVVRANVPQCPPPATPNERVDPIAQSFFTFGVEGGCYLTSIDLFFKTKDAVSPVWVELREMVNGFPSNTFISAYCTAQVQAADVLISNDASLATNFKFEKLIYLPTDRDYCFVVQTRCDRYELFTARMGESSTETGNVVFKQAYCGSMFKSENNYTWSPEQTEDIKFVLYKAEFDTNVIANLNCGISANAVSVDSSYLTTVSETGYVYINFPFKHCLDLNSKISVACDPLGTYNGIAGTALNGSFPIFAVDSEYMVGFLLPVTTADVTGSVKTGGVISDIQVDNGGAGYSSTTLPTVVITPTSGGTGATATAVVSGGKIVDIIVTAGGTGYMTPPTITFTSAIGTGAVAVALIDAKFTINTNRLYHEINPLITFNKPFGTDVSATLQTTLAAFDGGAVTAYSAGPTYNIELGAINTFDANLMLASRVNEHGSMSNQNSAPLNIVMSSTNKNISPVIDLDSARINFKANSINNQRINATPAYENIAAVNAFGQVTNISITSGGTGYGIAPTVEIYGSGAGATATCTISGGSVDTITITDAGDGYITAPKVRFIGANSTPALATTTISEYNSEISASLGSALSRYITKQQTLDSVSTGLDMFVTAFSNTESSFDVYIRTSLSSSGDIHTDKDWKMITCDTTRNKSEMKSQYFDYKFYSYGISPFDTFSFKIVLRSNTPWEPPIIANYRAIILA